MISLVIQRVAKAIIIEPVNRCPETTLKSRALSDVDFFSMLVLQDQIQLSKAKHKGKGYKVLDLLSQTFITVVS
jgi:hypothetical protein